MSPNTRDVTGATPAPGQVVLQPGQPVIVLQPQAAEAPPSDGTPDALAPTHPTGQEVQHGHMSHAEERALHEQELRIYGHSNFFYWWPVWMTGAVMALLTWLHGQPVRI